MKLHIQFFVCFSFFENNFINEYKRIVRFYELERMGIWFASFPHSRNFICNSKLILYSINVRCIRFRMCVKKNENVERKKKTSDFETAPASMTLIIQPHQTRKRIFIFIWISYWFDLIWFDLIFVSFPTFLCVLDCFYAESSEFVIYSIRISLQMVSRIFNSFDFGKKKIK